MLSLVHTSRRLHRLLQRARPLQIIGFFIFLLQQTATLIDCSRFAASLNVPLKHFYFLFFISSLPVLSNKFLLILFHVNFKFVRFRFDNFRRFHISGFDNNFLSVHI